MSERGQVEVETIIGLIVVLFIFIGIITITSFRNSEIENISSISQNETECREIASIISYMASNSNSAEITIALNTDVNLFSDHISISGTVCDFFGTASTAQLSKGNVKIYESGGVIHAQNV